MKRNKSGVSMISLVISIVVLLILSVVVFSSSTETVSRAGLSTFTGELADFNEKIDNEFIALKSKYIIDGSELKKETMYYSLATGRNVVEVADVVPAGYTSMFAVDMMSEKIKGNAYYQITDTELLEFFTKNKGKRYKNQDFYLTDEGQVFMRPGFIMEDDDETQWWVTGKTYYVHEDDESYPAPTGVTLASVVSVGDFVNYTPKEGRYTPNKNNTGADNEALTTDTDTMWQVFSIEDGVINLTPAGGPVNSLTLRGIQAYRRGAEELHEICSKLYSNKDLWASARSMTIEDVNKAAGYTVKPSTKKWAYYPQGTTTYANLPDGYTAKVSGYPRIEIYDMATGGIASGDGDEAHRMPTADNPVIVTETAYWYTAGIKGILAEILGDTDGWLASSCVRLNDDYVDFYMRGVSASGGVGTHYVRHSAGYSGEYSLGLRPVVSLSSGLPISGDDGDGSLGDPWEINVK